LGAWAVQRSVPQGKVTLGVPGTSVEHSSLAGALFSDETVTPFPRTGDIQMLRLGRLTPWILGACIKLAKASLPHDHGTPTARACLMGLLQTLPNNQLSLLVPFEILSVSALGIGCACQKKPLPSPSNDHRAATSVTDERRSGDLLL
jgi:hypothetical protein